MLIRSFLPSDFVDIPSSLDNSSFVKMDGLNAVVAVLAIFMAIFICVVIVLGSGGFSQLAAPPKKPRRRLFKTLLGLFDGLLTLFQISPA